ncbi:MAG: hypothetical protein N3D84_03345, partial [Candidatus Woesearchaeota archaeon]|nr:hypothetical protein [Candidatus Woesearchaeota archaeon]
YYYCSDIDEYKFKNSVGVALKRTSNRGIFRLGGWIFTLGVKYANTPLIVFFNKGYCRDNLYKTEKNYEEYCNEHYGKRRIIKEYERHSKESPLLFDMYGKPIKLAYIPKKDKQKKKLKEELDNKCKEGMQHLVEKRQDLEIYSNGTPVQSVQSFDGA